MHELCPSAAAYADLEHLVEADKPALSQAEQKIAEAEAKSVVDTAKKFIMNPKNPDFTTSYENLSNSDELKCYPKLSIYTVSDYQQPGGVEDPKLIIDTVLDCVYADLDLTVAREEAGQNPMVNESPAGQPGHRITELYLAIDDKTGIRERRTEPMNGETGPTYTQLIAEKRLDNWC